MRVFTPIHIPIYLIEQIKDRDWTVEDYIKYHEINCLSEIGEGSQIESFFTSLCSCKRCEYYERLSLVHYRALNKRFNHTELFSRQRILGKGRAVEKLAEHIKFIHKKGELNKILWVTNYPKHSQKYGFKQSKSILMEYSRVDNGKV